MCHISVKMQSHFCDTDIKTDEKIKTAKKKHDIIPFGVCTIRQIYVRKRRKRK